MKSLRALFLFLLALLSGCASSMAQAPDLIAPSAGKAVIYIYRVDLFTSAESLAPNVRINYENIGTLTRRGYFRVEVDPGPIQVALYKFDRGEDNTFWPAEKNSIVDLKLAPNSTHFVELSLNASAYSFGEVSRDTALKSLSGMHPLN
jgi:hypothetical protein